VKQAAVGVWKAGSTEARLVGYVAGRTLGSDAEALRQWLRERLPDVMVPGLWVELAELPATVNGKLDRRRLPAPELPRTEKQSRPQGPIEELVAGIWSEVLRIGEVGREANFFELGGHSLMAMRVVSRLRRKLDVEVPVRALFEAPTVRELGARLELMLRARSGGPDQGWQPVAESRLVTLRGAGAEAPVFLAHPLGSTVFCYTAVVRHLPPGRPVFGFQGSESRDRAMESTIEGMAARYLTEMRTVQPVGPYCLAGWSLGGLIVFEMARQLEEEGEGVEALVLIDSDPFYHEVDEQAVSQLEFLNILAGDLGVPLDRLPDFASAERAGLSLDDLWDRVLQEVRALQLLPADLDSGLLRQQFDAFKANHDALLVYRPRPYPGRAVLVLAENDDPARCGRTVDAWRNLVGELEAFTIPGDHHSIIAEPRARVLAGRIQAALSRHQEEGIQL
jgi:thioesterase domain-containing protein/acyl carrier protein